MLRLHGKYLYTKRYNDAYELYSILKDEFIKSIKNRQEEIVERYIIYPSDPNLEIILYFKPKPDEREIDNDNILIGLFLKNKPSRVTVNQLLEMLFLIPGFLEKYYLDKYSYLNDLEYLKYLESIYGFNNILYSYSANLLLRELREKLYEIRMHNKNIGKSISINKKDYNMPMIDNKMSVMLEDVLYRASYMLGNFKIIKIYTKEFLQKINNILMEQDNMLIHIMLNKYDIWIEKNNKNKIGVYVSNSSSGMIVIKTYKEFVDFIKYVIDEMEKRKISRIYIYTYYKNIAANNSR